MRNINITRPQRNIRDQMADLNRDQLWNYIAREVQMAVNAQTFSHVSSVVNGGVWKEINGQDETD